MLQLSSSDPIVDGPDDTEKRPLEARLMAALDRMAHEIELAMGKLQDDGRMSGPTDRAGILRSIHIVESKAAEVKELLRTSGSYSSSHLDGDADY